MHYSITLLYYSFTTTTTLLSYPLVHYYCPLLFYFDATLNLRVAGNLGMLVVGLLGMLPVVGLLGMLPVTMFFTY